MSLYAKGKNMYARERLREIITDHYNYEVIELANCKTLFRYFVPQFRQFINMNLEHTLLHSRVLYEFYYRLKLKYDDTSYPRANMYITDFTRPAYTENIKDENKETNELGFWIKVSNQILHLGKERTSDPSSKFTLGEALNIANDLLRITKNFLGKLEKVENGYYFDATLRTLLGIVQASISEEKFPSR